MVSELAERNILSSAPSALFVQPGAKLDDQRFLACSLADQMIVVLPVKASIEVITVTTDQITPIPHMSPWIIGVYNWRGEALWVVDMGHLFGFDPWYQQPNPGSTHSILVLRSEAGDSHLSKSLGAVVGKVQDIQAFDLNLLHPPSPALTTPQLAPFLKGYWLTPSGDMLAYLDVDAIFSMIAK